MKTALFVKPAQCSLEMLLAVTGTAENHSEHPIGLAITNYAKQVGLPFTSCVQNSTEKIFSLFFSCKMLRNKQYHSKVLPKSFHLNGNIIGSCSQTQMLEAHKQLVTTTFSNFRDGCLRELHELYFLLTGAPY